MARHLSMRIPWRDQPWDGQLCSAPLDNGACLLLSNIGDKRDDGYERASAGKPIEALDQDRLPCLSERGTFMSPYGYRVVKVHPYSYNKALRGHLEPTPLTVPGYTFEAVPFRWLSRFSFEDELHDECPEYNPEFEDRARSLMAFQGSWLMDARNQRAVIDQFFQYIEPGSRLVFIYLKHSPLQEGSSRRLLVGAARVTDVMPPQMWRQSGQQPFDSSMWETLVRHSLRPDQRDGVLLPYQDLVRLMDDGSDIGQASSPSGRRISARPAPATASGHPGHSARSRSCTATRSCRPATTAAPGPILLEQAAWTTSPTARSASSSAGQPRNRTGSTSSSPRRSDSPTATDPPSRTTRPWSLLGP